MKSGLANKTHHITARIQKLYRSVGIELPQYLVRWLNPKNRTSESEVQSVLEESLYYIRHDPIFTNWLKSKGCTSKEVKKLENLLLYRRMIITRDMIFIAVLADMAVDDEFYRDRFPLYLTFCRDKYKHVKESKKKYKRLCKIGNKDAAELYRLPFGLTEAGFMKDYLLYISSSPECRYREYFKSREYSRASR